MRIVGTVLLLLLGAMVACSSSSASGDGTCPAYCSSACQALGQCNVMVGATCASDCESGVGTNACASLRPISQYTCEEIQTFANCASYCSAFCQRVPTCGAFDETLCLQGCAIVQPPICNPASVAARTCDQLKPEARNYQDTASTQNSGGASFVGASPQAYGLCESASDCPSSQACSMATSTCGPCKTNADCSQLPGLSYACLSGGTCAMVDCLTTADCVEEVCSAQYKCVQCVTDADCAASPVGQFAPKCGPGNLCGACVTDADCAASGGTCGASGVCSVVVFVPVDGGT